MCPWNRGNTLLFVRSHREIFFRIPADILRDNLFYRPLTSKQDHSSGSNNNTKSNSTARPRPRLSYSTPLTQSPNLPFKLPHNAGSGCSSPRMKYSVSEIDLIIVG